MVGPLSAATASMKARPVLISFATGWGLISLLSLVTADHWARRPFIPGAAIGLTGVALIGGTRVLRYWIWPYTPGP